MTPKPRALGSLLTEGQSPLTGLAAESKARFALRERVRRCLPAIFAPQCSQAELEGDVLVVSMESAASATVLRYQVSELQARLGSDGFICHRIRVQVLPTSAQAVTPPHPRRSFEEPVRHRLETTAASLEDGVLRRSIQNLARHRREPQ